MRSMTDLLMGVYKHYKGNLYQVLGLAHDANAGELFSHRRDVARSSSRAPSGDRVVVVYIGLQLDEDREGPRMAVRTLEDFTAWVHPSDGSVCNHPQTTTFVGDGSRPHCLKFSTDLVQRFAYLGPEFRADMLQ